MCEKEGFRSFQGQYLSNLEKKNQRTLREAIKSKDIDLVKSLIINGTLPTSSLGTRVNHNCTYFSYPTPLHLAVISRCPEIVKILLEAGANINLKDRIGDTPLTLAAKTGDNSIIDILLSFDVQNTETTYEDLSHLHIACMRNKTDVVRKLLVMNQARNIDEAVKPNSVFWAGYRALHFAVQYGCTETVKLLLSCGADITAMDVRQMTPLHLADFQRNEEILDLLLAEHKSVFKNPGNSEGLSHLHIACTRDNPMIAEHFLKLGVDVDLKSESLFYSEWRPIHFATYYQCTNVVKLLLQAGTYLGGLRLYNLLRIPLIIGDERIHNLVSQRRTLNAKFHKKYQELTKLHRACIQDDKSKIMDLLPCHNSIVPQVNKPNWTGCTLAHLVARYCDSDSTLKLLLNRGVNFMAQDAEGKTPLHIAFGRRKTWDSWHQSWHQSIDSVMCGTDIQNLTDETGLSIFHILCSTNNLGVINGFLSQGIDIDAQVGNNSALWAGFTAMHFATHFLRHEVVILLLKHGASISIRNTLNFNPYDILVYQYDNCFDSPEYRDRLVESLMAIFSYRPKDVMEHNMTAISPLHAMCTHKRDQTMLQEFPVLLKEEMNKYTNLPKSHRFNKCTALHLAMQQGLFDKAKFLLENKADPYVVNSRGETPLESAAHLFIHGTYLSESMRLLFLLQTSIETYKPSHFHLACLVGLVNDAKRLLHKTHDVKLRMKLMNSLDDDRETPLHSVITASADSHKYRERYLSRNDSSMNEIVDLLLKNGSFVDSRDFQMQTPLHMAELIKSLRVMSTLISYGADVNAQDLYGQTPLHLMMKSLKGNNKGRLDLLLQAGADMNIVDELGCTCLMDGSEESDVESYYYDESEEDLGDCYVMLLEHITKLRIIEYHISVLNLEAYVDLRDHCCEFFNEAAFVCKCEKELEAMKTIKIDSSTTSYDILFKSLKKMVYYSSNPVLNALLNSQSFSKKYPIYGYLIRLQSKRGRARGPLLNSSINSFSLLSRKSLPSICLDTIFEYLSNADLRNMCLSVSL